MHECMPMHNPTTPSPPKQKHKLLSLHAVTNCRVFTLKRQMCSHPLRCVSPHHSECTILSRGELGGGVMGLQLYNIQIQLHVSLLSCIWGVKKSRGQQRRDSSLNLTQVIWTLLKIGQWPVWEGFSTTCPTLSSVLCYRFITCAAEGFALSYKKQRPESVAKRRSHRGKWSRTEILAHFVEAMINVCLESDRESARVRISFLQKDHVHIKTYFQQSK